MQLNQSSKMMNSSKKTFANFRKAIFDFTVRKGLRDLYISSIKAFDFSSNLFIGDFSGYKSTSSESYRDKLNDKGLYFSIGSTSIASRS